MCFKSTSTVTVIIQRGRGQFALHRLIALLGFLVLTLFAFLLQYRTGRTLGSGTYAIVKEAIHIKTGKYYACKVINKKLMEGREHMVNIIPYRPLRIVWLRCRWGRILRFSLCCSILCYE